MAKCPFCNEEAYGTHIYGCSEKPKKLDNKKEIKKTYIDEKVGFEINRSWFHKKYHLENYSYVDFKEDFGLSYRDTNFLIDYLEISKKSKTEYYSQAVKKRRKTLKEKYGVKNASKLDFVKEKKERSFLENYGVDNIFKDDGFKEHAREKMIEKYGKESVPNLYGNADPYGWNKLSEEEREDRIEKLKKEKEEWWASLSDNEREREKEKRRKWWAELSKEEKEDHVEKTINRQKYRSNLEDKFEREILSKLTYEYETQCFISGKAFDFYLINFNVLIEVNGDYWHANPKIYKKDDLVSLPDKKIKAKSIWDKDKEKKELARDYGYSVLTVWEQEILESVQRVNDKVKNFVEKDE